jgi:hypothetical protein
MAFEARIWTSRRIYPWTISSLVSIERHIRSVTRLLIIQTISLLVLLFVAAPLQAGGLFNALFGLLFGIVLYPGVHGVGQPDRVVFISFSIALVAAIGRRQPSDFDKLVDDIAWLTGGTTLCVVVAHAVFVPGKVLHERMVIGIRKWGEYQQ